MTRVRDLILPEDWKVARGVLKQMVREINALLGVLISASPVIGPRRRLNLLSGSNMTITAVDRPDDDAVDLTFAATGGGSGVADGDYVDIEVSDSGETWQIKPGVVDTAEIADGAVTTDKIEAGAVTATEIANGAVGSDEIAASAVDTAELAAGAVTNAKMDDMAEATIKGRADGAGAGAPQDLDADDIVDILGNATAFMVGFFGDGSDGPVTIGAGTTSLTRAQNYTTLVVQNGGILQTNNWPISASVSITVDAGGKIHNDGNAAGAAPTAGGTLNNGGYAVQTNGGGGGSTSGAGNAGNGPARRLGGTGGAGGAGPSGAGGGAAALTATKIVFPGQLTMQALVAGVSTVCGAGSGGGGGGADGAGPGTGGGGGGGGGVVVLASPEITNNGTISAVGGVGGNAAAVGAAGGGGGGGGGYIATLCKKYTGTAPSVAGGNNGTGFGTGGVNGSPGGNGTWADIRI